MIEKNIPWYWSLDLFCFNSFDWHNVIQQPAWVVHWRGEVTFQNQTKRRTSVRGFLLWWFFFDIWNKSKNENIDIWCLIPEENLHTLAVESLWKKPLPIFHIIEQWAVTAVQLRKTKLLVLIYYIICCLNYLILLNDLRLL